MLISNWLRKKFGHPDTNLYSFHPGPIFTNGAAEMVFNQETTLPAIVARGAGRVAGSYSILQPAQLRVQHSVPVVGIGGLQAGQIALQGLMHPDDLGTV